MTQNYREADMDPADDLLQRALLDAEACASVALKVSAWIHRVGRRVPSGERTRMTS